MRRTLPLAAAAGEDPAVVAWRVVQRAYRRWLAADEAGNDEAWRAYEVAWDRLIAARPTTVRGVQAKVAAAHSEPEAEAWVKAMLASVLAVDPRTLAAG